MFYGKKLLTFLSYENNESYQLKRSPAYKYFIDLPGRKIIF